MSRMRAISLSGRLRRLVPAEGNTLPEIYTPDELMGE
jgi:hypothetical protein